MDGVDMLTNLKLQSCQGNEEVTRAVKDIDAFVISAKQLQLNNPKEFRQLFDTVMTSETRVIFCIGFLYKPIYFSSITSKAESLLKGLESVSLIEPVLGIF
ncbi:hypothetical protein DPMN_134660 [Dreissena polymorpha]|uniref:Guanine nucleotide exchange factor DBS-like spectrin-like domain-containing protein n=1 Tax=Dreissena polymorpha TaxID=45954 RepID=A0A9D4FXQ9_DREPO|nr:hypothetical protein DPMN_134660 [Dreissena polymorpha]